MAFCIRCEKSVGQRFLNSHARFHWNRGARRFLRSKKAPSWFVARTYAPPISLEEAAGFGAVGDIREPKPSFLRRIRSALRALKDFIVRRILGFGG